MYPICNCYGYCGKMAQHKIKSSNAADIATHMPWGTSLLLTEQGNLKLLYRGVQGAPCKAFHRYHIINQSSVRTIKLGRCKMERSGALKERSGRSPIKKGNFAELKRSFSSALIQ